MFDFSNNTDRFLPNYERNLLPQNKSRIDMDRKGHFTLKLKSKGRYDSLDLWTLAHTQKEYAGFLLFGHDEVSRYRFEEAKEERKEAKLPEMEVTPPIPEIPEIPIAESPLPEGYVPLSYKLPEEKINYDDVLATG